MESSESGGVRDQVQKAIDDLRAAGEKATGDVRSRIDDAIAQLRDVSGDATGKAAGDHSCGGRSPDVGVPRRRGFHSHLSEA